MLAKDARLTIAQDLRGETVELRQSLYFGDLYDENEKWLLSPYPFENTSHIVDHKGVPINPRRQKGIIPAGSSFIIEKVEFPDPVTLAQRMLTSPRFNPWVYLRPEPNSEFSRLYPENKPYILPLPLNMTSIEEVHTSIATFLDSNREVRSWLSERRPTIRVAIHQKEIIRGMSQEELIASMGEPYRWFSDEEDSKKTLIAWYPGKEAWLKNGQVTEILQPSRALPTVDAPPIHN